MAVRCSLLSDQTALSPADGKGVKGISGSAFQKLREICVSVSHEPTSQEEVKALKLSPRYFRDFVLSTSSLVRQHCQEAIGGKLFGPC